MRIHVKVQDKIYDVKIDDLLSRPIQAEVDGEVFEVWPEESSKPLSEQKPTIKPRTAEEIQSDGSEKLEESNSLKSYLVIAPIPGVIIEIKVNPGDVIEYGQELCILEAMKMKNSIRAGKSGTIDKILVTAGDQVSQSQTLMEYHKEELPK
jgi:glutaconyl-CoA/methylmalonyl-CoA decarboxylase subunit gamma